MWWIIRPVSQVNRLYIYPPMPRKAPTIGYPHEFILEELLSQRRLKYTRLCDLLAESQEATSISTANEVLLNRCMTNCTIRRGY